MYVGSGIRQALLFKVIFIRVHCLIIHKVHSLKHIRAVKPCTCLEQVRLLLKITPKSAIFSLLMLTSYEDLGIRDLLYINRHVDYCGFKQRSFAEAHRYT